MDGFDEFWRLYPRRIARAEAEKAWRRMTPSEKQNALAALPDHLSYWSARGTAKEYMPYPGTWLNGKRWDDELEMPKAADEWWKSQRGIEAKAREVGCWPARANEGWHELKARVMAKIAA